MNDDFFSKFEEETRERLASPVQETFIERKKREYAINPDVDYPDPEYVIEIGGTPTLPKGNLIALSAKWKNGKTFLCDVLTAVFLGSERFAGCRTLLSQGKVSFYDTEQAKSDTYRVRKVIDAMTPEGRHHDCEVYCLRDLSIDPTSEDSDELTRYEFITQTIAYDKPDLVIIDGIADLLYNYNDVIESQRLVNRLAALANMHNCAMVVVMHQNKGLHDKNMKGHLGTMLNQKCSDVFSVEKCGGIFVVSNTISRHQPCGDFVFKLTADGIPEDGTADRKQQMEIRRQDERAKLREQISICLEDATVALKRSDIIKLIQEKLGLAQSHCYRLFNESVAKGVIASKDGKHFYLVPTQAVK